MEAIDELPRKVRLGLYYAAYGALLNEKRLRIMGLWLNDDFSFSEIAQCEGITRQGVYDSVKNSERILEKAERDFGIVSRSFEQEKILRDCLSRIRDTGCDAAAGIAQRAFLRVAQLWEENAWPSKD